jgi:hypothetical protein
LLLEISDNTVDLFLDPVLMKQTFLHEDVVSVSIVIFYNFFVIFLYNFFNFIIILFYFCLSTSNISIGDTIVPYHENFKLYIVCKHPDPHFAPELCAKVNIINFGITRFGLEDELLTIGIFFYHLVSAFS